MAAAPHEQARLLRITARSLARSGLVHAFGHCSVRLDEQCFLVTPAKPLGNIGPVDETPAVQVDGVLADGIPGEVRIHQAIYRQRPDVNAICRVTPFHVELLSLLRRTPRARHGLGALFDPLPLWDDPRLLRDDQAARRLAQMLGAGRVIVMRANGAVAVGMDLADALATAWLLEDAAKVEVGLAQMGRADAGTLLDADEMQARRVTSAHVSRRLWDFLTASDEEAPMPRPAD